ncbi:cytochrome P450 [Rhodococcus sp. WS4]|nr:cytochrome P450 [Rhodococcus sp. WS4]
MTETVPRPTTEATDDLPQWPMMKSGECPFDPPNALRKLHAEQPISRVRLWDGSTPWLITRYDDVRTLLGDPRVSANSMNPGFPHSDAGFKERFQRSLTFLNMDGEDQSRIRRMVTSPFAVKRVEAMRPGIQARTDQLIDNMLAGPKPTDLVEAFALPLPSAVISELLGVPHEDHKFFQDITETTVNRNSTPAEVARAVDELRGFVDKLIALKLDDPADDLLSELAQQRVIPGELTRREAADLGLLLLTAGHETTANMISLGTLLLLEHPDQLALLRDSDDPRLVAGAVEEILRYLTIPHFGRRRVAAEDIEFNGHLIRAGEGIILAADVANREADVFPDPDRVDIERDARRQIAFGFGVHQCLGQPLARVELQVVWSTLFRRIPTLSLATTVDKVPFKHDALIYGLYELPVTW